MLHQGGISKNTLELDCFGEPLTEKDNLYLYPSDRTDQMWEAMGLGKVNEPVAALSAKICGIEISNKKAIGS